MTGVPPPAHLAFLSSIAAPLPGQHTCTGVCLMSGSRWHSRAERRDSFASCTLLLAASMRAQLPGRTRGLGTAPLGQGLHHWVDVGQRVAPCWTGPRAPSVGRRRMARMRPAQPVPSWGHVMPTLTEEAGWPLFVPHPCYRPLFPWPGCVRGSVSSRTCPRFPWG